MRSNMIRSILMDLNSSSTDIKAAALVSIDGLLMASALTEEYDEDHVGAMSAAILSIGERTAEELACGELEQVLIKGKSGYVLVAHASSDAVITVVTRSTARLGLVFLDVQRAAQKIEKLLTAE